MTDKSKNTAANIFDRTSRLASGLAEGVHGNAASGFLLAAGISKLVATLIRTFGAEDAKALIEELAKRRNEGTISDDDVASDDASIAKSVQDLFDVDADPDVSSKAAKSSKSKRRASSKSKT